MVVVVGAADDEEENGLWAGLKDATGLLKGKIFGWLTGGKDEGGDTAISRAGVLRGLAVVVEDGVWV